MSSIMEKGEIRAIIGLMIEEYFYDYPGISTIHLVSNYFIKPCRITGKHLIYSYKELQRHMALNSGMVIAAIRMNNRSKEVTRSNKKINTVKRISQ